MGIFPLSCPARKGLRSTSSSLRLERPMLSISALSGGDQWYYLSLVNINYYTEGGEQGECAIGLGGVMVCRVSQLWRAFVASKTMESRLQFYLLPIDGR